MILRQKQKRHNCFGFASNFTDMKGTVFNIMNHYGCFAKYWELGFKSGWPQNCNRSPSRKGYLTVKSRQWCGAMQRGEHSK